MASRSLGRWTPRRLGPEPEFGGERHFRLFAPRMGFAYNWTSKTVVRAGAESLPLQRAYFSDAPWGQTINQYGTSWLSTLDGSVAYYSLSNPFPNGFNQTPGAFPPAAQARSDWRVLSAAHSC